MEMKEIIDCHYCDHASCESKQSEVDCYVEDYGYFDHHVVDSKKEAEECGYFSFCDVFPKY